MALDKECEGYARECARLATHTDDPQLRDNLMEMAKRWMALAAGENVDENVDKTPLAPSTASVESATDL